MCKVPGCESTSLVYSGVDAFVLGLPTTEQYCYKCANAYKAISDDIQSRVVSAV